MKHTQKGSALVMVLIVMSILTLYGLAALRTSYYTGSLIHQRVVHEQHRSSTEGLLHYAIAGVCDNFDALMQEGRPGEYHCSGWPVGTDSVQYHGRVYLEPMDECVSIEAILFKQSQLIQRMGCVVVRLADKKSTTYQVCNWR